MRITVMAAMIAAAATTMMMPSEPASAAGKKQIVTNLSAQSAYPTRRRARVTVRRRSYLDGGTEVLQGERKFLDYAIRPNSSPLDVLGPGQSFRSGNYALPSQWDLPGSGLSF